MGYTNHWKNNSQEKFDKPFVSVVKKIVEYSNVAICDGCGHGEPVINENEISLNGCGKDSYESFSLRTQSVVKKIQKNYPEFTNERSFCKTNNKPYDVVVKAILLAAISKHYIEEVKADDGYPEEDSWARARELFVKAVVY